MNGQLLPNNLYLKLTGGPFVEIVFDIEDNKYDITLSNGLGKTKLIEDVEVDKVFETLIDNISWS